MAAHRVALAGVLSSVEAAILFNSQKHLDNTAGTAGKRFSELGQALAKNTTRLASAGQRIANYTYPYAAGQCHLSSGKRT